MNAPRLVRPRGRKRVLRADGIGDDIDTIEITLRHGQRVIVHADTGAAVEIERYESGAVEARNPLHLIQTANGKRAKILRQWSPKEAAEA